MSKQSTAVIGAGAMGADIAMLCAWQGMQTINIDISADRLERARTAAQERMRKQAQKGRMSAESSVEVMERLMYSTRLEDIAYVDVVIEAVSEDIELKKRLLTQIEQYVGENTVILSNTSSLAVSDIAIAAKRPERVMGAHFFNPPTVMKLIEMIRGEKTSDETYEKALQFIAQLNKQPVVAPETPGFIVNRLLIPMINEAAFLLMQGAEKEDIDQAMKLGANHKMGPLELGDFIGWDVVLAIMKTLCEGFNDNKYRPCPLIEQMVKQGILGRKTKQGFYTYS